jgi:DNA-binding NtrC family response regulator
MQEEVQDIHGAGKLALLVEDDQIIREALWTILEEYDFQIITASNGTQALNILEQVGEQISFVITDIVMPKMNGIHLYKAAQDMGLKKEFLFITGHPLTKDRQNFLEKSDVRWLKKPFSMNDFLQVLQDIL